VQGGSRRRFANLAAEIPSISPLHPPNDLALVDKRQQSHAYSNLAKLPSPLHIRLSMHGGPKFGIRLFPDETVRPAHRAASLLSTFTRDGKSDDELQISTPWHIV
jgi:pyoverdine/dityrosine biosynthesis protein Dit1